jgi:DHA1 family tetracycline resistance protein-like MFS transporter
LLYSACVWDAVGIGFVYLISRQMPERLPGAPLLLATALLLLALVIVARTLAQRRTGKAAAAR